MDKQTEDGAFEIAVEFAPAPDPQPEPAAAQAGDEPAEPEAAPADAPTPAPPAGRALPERLRGSLPLLLAGLAIFAALAATIGLVVVSRNVAETNQRLAALQTAIAHQSAAPAPRAPALPARAAMPITGPADKPASVEEVRALLFALRKDIVGYQALGGNAGWAKAIRDAQAELANRLNAVAEKVDRIDRRMGGVHPEAR